MEPLIDFDSSLSMAMFIYPTKSTGILDNLKRKIAEMEATIETDLERGRVIDPSVQVALDDARELQEQLAKGAERFFQYSLYITVPAKNKESLSNTSQLVESTLGSISITARPTTLQMYEGFVSTMPLGQDPLYLNHNMDTTSLATTFPFVSSELTASEGIIYGINEHNDSLIIFDRFSQENANCVVFATSGAGKSYFVKLEALRSLMFGTEVIIIDPEREYLSLAQAVGGDYINFSTTSPVKINPFDLPEVADRGEDELGRKILSLTGFLKLVLGELNPTEAAVLDRAINATYRLKGITTSTPKEQLGKIQPPLMEDLYKAMIGMEDPIANSLAVRLERFIKGSLAGIFSTQSNIQIQNQLTVFSVRDLPDQLRPLAMYLILDYIWTKIRHSLKKRLLIVDEAWYMMRYPDSAAFLIEMVKRARKYYLGVTTINQDVEDFLGKDQGKMIISNSSMQVLLKQAPASIEKLGQTFNLSQGEKRLLLTAGVGRGLFFAGNNHVAIRIVASEEEHKLITTNPKEIIEKQQESPAQ
ncbi:MAG: Type IV secretory pathway VirB4 component-like protein [Candidatus Daviesbacteria bacterium GW2011_GWA2_40_9]|uniref:Type IV secretory pathway VirB4 component-like protein n=1 Tax=Candidatus Daviesbacteria bacterium GW2011_GWA2_40_9 TaxID=1618424 RepID=A0A0G0U0Z3_9BACT|nr:MAG: Type IV secretory pathway VirB4 component-like protein [Candidatus Daviesbacteria bacterium GW2011_GWA2_40_9]